MSGQTFVMLLDGKDICGYLKLTDLLEVETHSLSLPVKLLINGVKYKYGEMFIDVPPNSLAGTRLFLSYKGVIQIFVLAEQPSTYWMVGNDVHVTMMYRKEEDAAHAGRRSLPPQE